MSILVFVSSLFAIQQLVAPIPVQLSQAPVHFFMGLVQDFPAEAQHAFGLPLKPGDVRFNQCLAASPGFP